MEMLVYRFGVHLYYTTFSDWNQVFFEFYAKFTLYFLFSIAFATFAEMDECYIMCSLDDLL